MVRTISKWIFFLFLSILGLVVFLAVFLVVLISSPPGQRYLKGIIQDQAGRALEREVRIGSVETDIFSRVRVRDVRIYQVSEGRIIPFLNLERATVRYELLPLLERKVLLRAIAVRGMQVNVVTDSTGKTNIPLIGRKPSGQPSGPPSIQVEIQRITLSRSTLRYRNQVIPLDLTVIETQGATTRRGSGYNFRAAADSVRFAFRQSRLNASGIRANGSFNNGLLRLDALSVNLPGLTATGSRLAFRSGPDSLLAGSVRLVGSPGQVLDFLRTTVAPGIPPVSGIVDLRAELSGNPKSPRVSATLAAPVLQVRNIPMQESFARVTWDNPTVRVDSLSLAAFGGRLHGYGTLNTRTFLAEKSAFVFQGLDVKRMAQLGAGLSAYSGKASGTVAAAGVLNRPDSLRAEARITVQAPSYQGRRFPDIDIEAAVLNGNARAGLTDGNATVTADAVIKGRQLNGSFTAAVPQISDFAGPAGIRDLTGSVSAQGTVGGTLSSPVVRTTLAGRLISYMSFPVDSLAGDVIWQRNRLSFSDLRASGKIASVANLRPPLHVDSLSGAVQYTGIINGDLTSPRGEISLDLENPAYRDIRFNNGLIRAVVHGDSVDILHAALESDSLRVLASGTLDYKTLKGSAAVELDGKTGSSAPTPGARVSAVFDVKNMNAFSASVRGGEISLPFLGRFIPSPPPVEGTLNFEGTVGGSVKNPDARVAFNVLRPGYRAAYLDSLRGEAVLQNGRVFLEPAEFFRDNFHSVLNASLTMEKTASFYTVTGNSPVRGTLTGDNLALGFVQSLLPPAAGKITGTAAYDLTFDGTLSNPHPQGTAGVGGFALTPAANGPSITGADITAEVHDDQVALSVHNGLLLQKPFSVEALLNYTPPGFGGNVDFFLDGQKALNLNGTYVRNQMDVTTRIEDFNLSVLRAFVPALKSVSGVVNSNLSITGTLQNPQPNGTVKVRDLSLDLPDWDMPMRNGVVSLNITPNRVDVDTLFVKSRKGSIRATGYLDNVFSKAAKGELSATVDNVQVRKRNLADVTVKSAQLTLTGAGDSYLIAGKASLGETKILYNLSVQTLLERLTAPQVPPAPSPDYMKKIHMDIVVDGGDRIYIQNSLADIRSRADFEVIGTLAAPNVLGTATVVEGDVQYLDRKFTIREGTVQFTDRTELNPTLDFQAETTVTTYSMFGSEPYKITLAVTGTSKAPTVKMSSDPPLGEPDIVSLLTLGVTREQVGLGPATSDTTTSLQNVLKQRAELLTSQRLAGYLGHEIGGLLGLQSLTVEGNLFNIYGEEGGPRIIASKQISPNVELTYISSIGRQSDQGIQVNYAVTDKITLRGQTDSQGRSGLDILFRLRFR